MVANALKLATVALGLVFNLPSYADPIDHITPEGWANVARNITKEVERRQAAAKAGESMPCMGLDGLKKKMGPTVHWTELTKGQYHFMQGIYVMNPETPKGLPPGDAALLATKDGDASGIVVWTRETLACSPAMPIPDALIKLMDQVKTGKTDANGEEL